ncbi:hypothetical protein ATY79_02055 [Rhizobium sp. R693]|nr:hypothetical protein ATY79_02055 [Rhizobium sp. R693]
MAAGVQEKRPCLAHLACAKGRRRNTKAAVSRCAIVAINWRCRHNEVELEPAASVQPAGRFSHRSFGADARRDVKYETILIAGASASLALPMLVHHLVQMPSVCQTAGCQTAG